MSQTTSCASPGSLIEFVVNLRTAKALGLSIRDPFLLLGDEVIE